MATISIMAAVVIYNRAQNAEPSLAHLTSFYQSTFATEYNRTNEHRSNEPPLSVCVPTSVSASASASIELLISGQVIRIHVIRHPNIIIIIQ
ncbi:hypothetical protein AND_010269 [Anopheles darlingi]|uniref:Uncharacterized protein n=1 Tax=Anopheles darlingi TaxID=43151 RepID=W5J5U6_ANODA|nr:hypothetical protein AND_010269 [Anopheles darlingi]